MMVAAMTTRVQISAAFSFVYVLWGSTFVAIRYAAQILHPALISGLRYVIASSILMVYLLARRYPVRMSSRELLRVGAVGIVMFSVNTTLLNYGGKTLSAGITALFLSTIPLFIAVLEAFLPGGAQMKPIEWLGTFTGFSGIVMLTKHSIHGQPLTSAVGLACAALLVASFAWAVGSVASRRMMFSTSPLVLGCWQMLIAGCVNMIAGFAWGGVQSSHWTRGAWIATLYLAVFGSLASYTSYLFLLRRVRISTVATYAYVNPVVAVLLGWLLLHERLHGLEWAGMLVVLASVAVVIRSKPRDVEPALNAQ
jgi:drug/metabolite transporter (DMT)-like permease